MDPPSERSAAYAYDEDYEVDYDDEQPGSLSSSRNNQGKKKLRSFLIDSSNSRERQDHSLPTPEEARLNALIAGTTTSSNNPYSGHRKRLWYLIGISAVALFAIVGLSLGISRSKKSSPSSASSLSSPVSTKPITGTSRPSDDVSKDQDGDDPNIWSDPNQWKDPQDQKLARLMNYVIQTITKREYLEEVNGPHFRAVEWLAMFDRMQLDVPKNDKEALIFRERYAMVVLYYSLQGENWELPLRFLSESSICEWNLLISMASSAENKILGVTCDQNDSVVNLFITGNNLVGPIPGEIGLLESLQRVSFYDNLISGELPPDMQYLTNLSFLAIETNSLSGTIPTWINSLTSLEYLALGDNQLMGTIPNLNGLRNLKELALDENQLTGDLDVLNTLTTLQSVFLNKNALDGRLHNGIFANAQDLEVLDLSDNLLTGAIPRHFYGYRVVDLHNNMLTGDLPDVTLPGLPLEYLSAHHNQLTGEIPGSFGALKEIRYLDLSYNTFTGRLLDSFNSLTNLEYLFLARNPLTVGRIPFLGSLASLVELSLQGTNRNGMIPSWIDQLTSLTVLDLQDNQLSGPIPEQLGNLPELSFLMINANRLYGEFPTTLANLQNLVVFFADKNELSGNVGPICMEGIGPEELTNFITDCDVLCDCCSKCCPEAETCVDIQVNVNFGPGYNRDQVIFSENLIFNLRSHTDD